MECARRKPVRVGGSKLLPGRDFSVGRTHHALRIGKECGNVVDNRSITRWIAWIEIRFVEPRSDDGELMCGWEDPR